VCAGVVAELTTLPLDSTHNLRPSREIDALSQHTAESRLSGLPWWSSVAPGGRIT
jgi:hypothetical protein